MRWWLLLLLAAAVAGKKKHRHHKPGRALLDRLSGTTVSEVIAASSPEGLLPAPLDVAPYARVAANATCGDGGAEEFCRDTPGKRGVVCDVCEGPDGPLSRRHPAAHAVDGDPATWWQSPTLAQGDYGNVELVATLPDKMELLHVIIKAGPSPRPLAWSLEVSPSESSEDWRLVRAFGDRDHCRKLWDLRPERRRRKAERSKRGAKRSNRADKPACSTQFVSQKPLESGEMHVGLGEGVAARRVRVSFRAAHASPARQQYYTVRALTLAARCLCHGHAAHCEVTSEGAKCDCTHGTCGAHCQRCCSGARWAPHAGCAGAGGCACGERGACAYDDSGAILCVNCTENRAGPLCDRCLTGFYNAVPDGPCLPCDCDPEGSDGSCKWDRRQHRITCSCYPGFSGHLCDACEDPSAVFPSCLAPTTPACKCDPRGVVDPSRVCDDVCECKANVVGERCDACAPGHFGLSSELAAGCAPCYCSHVTDSCAAAEAVEVEGDINLPMGEAWLVTDMLGNVTVEPSIDERGKPFLISYEVEGWELYYWITQSWGGERLASYGGEIRATMFWGIVRGDTGGNPTVGPDVILVAADGTKLAFANTSHEQPGQVQISAPLVEGSWYTFGEESTEPAGRIQLMDVLRDVRAVMLRAHFHFDQDEVRLEGVEVVGAHGTHVAREACACPAGYGGAWCARCAWQHVRVPHEAGALPRFECVPCACNGHASCTAVDGPCGECQHNTTGPHCERCLPGHYGNPVQGACKPCACPLYLPSNNFSPNCALASAEGDEFVCTQCPDGYTGDHCEHCDFGYWGSPTTPGSSCQPCACGGSPCHPDTGLCLTCPPHTEGARCEQCEEGYWFGSNSTSTPAGGAAGACVACACGAGALAAACDARSGQCACKEGFAGRACGICAEGHGGVALSCPPCRCGTAAINNDCDRATGACACAPGAAPPSCGVCLDEHYGLDVTGCLGCNCSKLGSESNACDIRTGQCRCRPHVTGRACDTCEEGYWGLQQGGCRRCACGAGAAACDPVSGLCACAAGVGGAQCDKCLPGYYGFGPAGCLPCPKCSDGKVCSPDSGRCVCPPRSRGPGCKTCAPGYHSRPNALGCHACRCGPGAVSNQCDPQSGQCKCRIGWVGTECDRCAPGHFGPRCRPCLCNVEGTKGCEDGVCSCDDEGRCPCKENVVGDKCDQCLQGTFGLSAASPSGCTACFCFGRAAYCTQAALTRAAVHAATPHHVTLLRGDKNVSMDIDKPFTIHPQHPDTTISLPWPPVPVYVALDKRFLGDRVTSYGGALRFTVEEEGGEELPLETLVLFPLVKIEGNGIVLNHYQRVPALNGTYAVRLHESLWEVRGQGALATRPAIMAALQNVERILLRVTTRAPTYYDHVHALLLNVSLDTAIPGLSRSEPALGVELCACSEEYSAPSCQEPAIGFWMPKQKVRITNVAGTIVINLEGDAQPCRCNGRAVACDPKTGACLNCTAGTGGPQCATCAEGYFGSPDAGGCQPCPCPSRAKNFASSCAMSAGRLQCLCKPGYTGPECEWCATGYYRSPSGACSPCACDPRGAAGPHCDARGRCRCRPRAAGDKCERCRAHREYMDDRGVCTACDNCTQTLLDSMEALSSDLRTRADPTELSRIPKPFPALLEFAHNTSQLQTALQKLAEDIQNTNSIEPAIKNFEEREHILFTEANRFKSEAARREEESYYLSLESMSGLEEVLKQRRKVGEQVAALDDFARGEKHLSAHRALKEAKHLLRRIKDVKLIDFLAGATDVFDTATLQSTAVQEYDYRLEDVQKRVRKLQAALEEWERKGDDLPRLGDKVWGAGDEVAAVGKRVRPKLASVRDTALRCRLVLEDITSLSANNLTDEIASALLHGQTLAIKFPSMLAELTALTLAAEEKEGILYNLTPVYRQKYLEPVERHVAELNEKAKQYKMVFSGARAAASLGVSAAHAWGGVADAVRDAREAADTAMMAVTAAATTFSRDSVPKAASAGISASNDLKRRGAELLARSDELRSKLESLHRAADVVSVSLRALGWSERALAERPRARVAETLHEASVRADRVFGTTRALYDEAAEVRRRARYNLRRKLTELQRHGDTQLGAAEEHVSQIRGNTLRGAELAEALAAAAAARAREHVAASRTMDPAFAALRDKIAKAKHAAQSISVSLTSASGGVSCSRSYPVTGASPAVTRLAVAVSFENNVRDGPMLHLVDDSQDTEKYMRLVVEKKRLQLSWDLGAGEAVIVHPELLQSTHDDTDQTSYRIEIERIWNTVHLSLERMGGGTPISASNTSSAGAVLLTGSQLWLGGRDREGGLPGCVHALYSDDASVGLWNFQRQPKEAQCTGCTQRWYNSGSRSGMPLVWFNGAGYAELRRSGLRAADRRQFSVALTFRTRDENALLFMALDAANNRSVSLVLRDCRVVFEVQYSSSVLRITAGGRHCDGQPAHVHAIRLFAGNRLERGSLRVNGEETLGSASPPVQDPAALPDLAAASYWLAGVPPGAAGAGGAGGGELTGLLGCIGALTVDREGYNILDTPTRFGVEPTCDNRVLRSAILEGSGYIELPSPNFRRKAALGITFRARAADGVLLYRAPTIEAEGEGGGEGQEVDDKHYLALLLVTGELHVIAAAGKAELKLRTNGTRFDDGRLHSVRLIRSHKQLELWVDEERVASGTLAGNAFPARARGLFVGGAGPGGRGETSFPTAGFTGTVADLIVDAQLQGFETAVNWSSAQLGRADSELRAEPRTEPRALQAEPENDAGCTKTSSYTVEAGAVKFGDARWSHAAVRLPAKAKELLIALQFRTFRPDGLLLLAPGSKAKPKHYLALLIREGRLRLVARGRKRRELSLAAAVADGTWRSVTIRISRSRLSLSSGAAVATAHAPALARAHRVLVGGLPAPPAPRTIPNSIVRAGGFVGCVRRVSVNGRGEDLVRDARSHHAVGQCFPNVEQAAYFAGDAYATWSNAWSFGEGPDVSTEIRLQFRSGEPSGVLLATRGLLLELKDGAIILTRYSWSGSERARVEARGAGGRALCDGRWHLLSARGAVLALDGGPELRAGPSATLHDDAGEAGPQAPAPLYIGGLPEGTTDWPDGGRENFKGCIRDVSVAGHKRDWPAMESLHSVLLDSCPVAQ